MKTFIALYQKKWSQFRFKDPEAPDILDKYVPLAIVVGEDAENVWMDMQGEHWSPNGEARPRIQKLGLQHTSMDVGDLVFDLEEHKLQKVAGCGFTEIHLSQLMIDTLCNVAENLGEFYINLR